MIFAVTIFLILSVIAALFQLALALGAPWGEYAMGGRFPGQLPVKMRIAALFQIVILLGIAFIVWTRSGLAFNQYYAFSKIAIWFVVAFFTLGSILNLLTPSKGERLVWGPVNLVLLAISIFVALNP